MKTLKESTVLVTKKSDEVKSSFKQIESLCRQIIFLPTIKIIPCLSVGNYDRIKNKFNEYDYLVFTSANAVNIFLNIFNNSINDFEKIKIVAIGKSTSKVCKEKGLKVDIIPETFSANGLLNIFRKENIVNKNILIPGSSISKNELTIELKKLGANADFIPIYDVQTNYDYKNEIEEVKNNTPDVFVFTSPSSFNNFLKLIDIKDASEYFDGKTICAIGSTTASAITNNGLIVNVVPENFSIDHLIEALIKFYELQKNIV